ncbi:MAG: toll/interleukin-1 receptor domain-containing protein [Deltaproteobacteria bacterium]|nr:toll/interleukin-1 receptor domain-containing protein [Deltaproteobacteria bacterium]
MSAIFISYRRDDSAPYAGRLYDRLCARFGADRVFMDVDGIPPGVDFVAHIGAKVASCDTMIAVIGKKWLEARDGNGQRRLDDPHDFVVLEVAQGLQRGIPVIPVLVGGASMPRAADLPDPLRGLAQREAVSLRDDEFHRDANTLITVLAKLPGLQRRSTDKIDPRQERLQRHTKALIWKAPLVFALVAFAIWWQGRRESQRPAPITTHAAIAQPLTGAWGAEVTYHWNAKHKEAFFFQPEGNRLYGTASFLGLKRGIDDGKIEGGEIFFSVRFQEDSASGTRERKNYYGGKIAGNEIRFRLQDDRGSPPLEFIATRVGEAGQTLR